MRILACSDIHNNDSSLRQLEKKSRKADAIVVAGDFTFFGEGKIKVLKKLNSFKKPVFLVHGNHEDFASVRKACSRLKNVTFIHKKVHRHEGITFVGHGGEGFALESSDFDDFAKKLKLKGEKIVFVTHQPPHKTKIDCIRAHHGSKSYRRFIMKHKPALTVCGHLHETQGMHDYIKKSRVINPGPKGMTETV